MRCKNLSEAFSKITESKRNFYFRNVFSNFRILLVSKVSEYKGKVSRIMYESDQLYSYEYRYFQGKISIFCKKNYSNSDARSLMDI